MILVTGANGIVGSAIVKKLIEQAFQVRILARPTSNLDLLKPYLADIEIAYGDILDIQSLTQALNGIDIIVHAAAVVTFGEVDTETMFKINVEGTQNIVNVALANKISYFAYISSVAAIGRPTNADSTSETTPWKDSKLNSAYAISKYKAELEVWRGIEEGLPAAMVNPSVVMGVGNWNNSSAKIFKNIYEGIKFYPAGYVNVVDVQDVAQAVLLLIKKKIIGERYIVSGHFIPYKEFFAKIAKALGRPAPKYLISKNLGLLGYYILKIFFPFYLKSRFITKETIVISATKIKFDATKSIKELGLVYTHLDESIERVAKELLQYNNSISVH
jgi:nucleoside-diphosphate-sugar epimerase